MLARNSTYLLECKTWMDVSSIRQVGTWRENTRCVALYVFYSEGPELIFSPLQRRPLNHHHFNISSFPWLDLATMVIILCILGIFALYLIRQLSLYLSLPLHLPWVCSLSIEWYPSLEAKWPQLRSSSSNVTKIDPPTLLLYLLLFSLCILFALFCSLDTRTLTSISKQESWPDPAIPSCQPTA